ncbi:MAG: DUF3306 domain-containing protein [Pseudomonadota bacterium]|nr:MAG: DUF3306 domain-containing protein [Pseudomonadota bacterium]
MPINPPENENFLARWSRRKREAVHDIAPEATKLPRSDWHVQHDSSATDDAPEPVLPPLDSLAPDSDLSGFMSPKVSAELRRQALRRVFSSAKFNVCDGLDDYAEDFREVEVIAGTAVHELRERLAKQHREEARAGAPAQAVDHDAGEDETPDALAADELQEDADAESDDDEPSNA